MKPAWELRKELHNPLSDATSGFVNSIVPNRWAGEGDKGVIASQFPPHPALSTPSVNRVMHKPAPVEEIPPPDSPKVEPFPP